MSGRDLERKRAYDRERMRRLRADPEYLDWKARNPDRAEEIRRRWRDKKYAEGLCTRCGKEVWAYKDGGLDRAICGTCQTVKEWGRAAYDAAGEEPLEPLLHLDQPSAISESSRLRYEK